MSKIKKISISELKPGMFIDELDISWIHSPFLRHRRKIEKPKDILLLKKAGVKQLSINLDKGSNTYSVEQTTSASKKIESDSQNTSNSHSESILAETKKISSTNETEETTESLSNELKTAKNIENKIHHLVNQLNDDIKNGKPINAKEILPIINDSLASIKRNDQALLTMLHMHRKDKRLDAHAFATFSLAITLALKTGCSKEQIETLGMAALLHDCGWSRLPINLFSKGKSYSANEHKLVKQHTQLATQALKKSKGISAQTIQLIEQHHELANGKGFPKQLEAEQLHELHPYLQVVDLYDEYLHGLEDSPAILAVNALKKLYQKSIAGWFPQTLVSEMIRILGVYPIRTVVQLSSGEVAIVTEINRKKPLQPKVKLALDSKHQIITTSEALIDLCHDEDERSISKVLEPDTLPHHFIE